MIIEMKNDELPKLLGIDKPQLGKYMYPLLNLANQQSKGTIPKVVGQMTDLIKEFKGQTIEEWEEWYLRKKPEAINNATITIMQMIENFRNVLNKIDKHLVEKWVKDLVISKTFLGLKIQEAVLKKGAEILRTNYRLATPEEEAKGLDGYIGSIAVSVKPDTYNVKASLLEYIKIKMISYKKIKGGIEVDFKNVIKRTANHIDRDLDDFQ